MTKTIYQLKITLKSVKPAIWRRILVESNTPLPALSTMIQSAMGWYGFHLHQFYYNRKYYGSPEDGDDIINYSKIIVSKMLKEEKDKMQYDYDFGDGWEHTVLLEKILAPEPGMTYPVCTAGKNACPPEDCGGPYGYMELLEIMADPAQPRHKDMKEWLIGDFDPRAFSVEDANARLKMNMSEGFLKPYRRSLF